MIKLRELKEKDAPFMLEWMHDLDIVKYMQANFLEKTIEDCLSFIHFANASSHDLHLAIVDDTDCYLGTVSLKNITSNSAEFAITIRRNALGKGIAKTAMHEIISRGHDVLKLDEIYWCVSADNKRAVRFYDKNQYQRVDIKKSGVYLIIKEEGKYSDNQMESLLWYIA